MLKPLKRLLAALAVIAPFSIASIWSSPAQTTHAPLHLARRATSSIIAASDADAGQDATILPAAR